MGKTHKPLSGITVIDMTRILAGPFATMILGQLGATIIKVESPQGDDSRHFGPFLKMKDKVNRGLSAYFTSLNSGKKSIIIDLKTKLGKQRLALVNPIDTKAAISTPSSQSLIFSCIAATPIPIHIEKAKKLPTYE